MTITTHELTEHRNPPRRPGESIELAFSFPNVVRYGGVLLCSPQPLLGGDLDNNVMRSLASGLGRGGRPVARFDYRGVGNSHDVEPGRSRFEYWKDVDSRRDPSAVLADAREALTRSQRMFDVAVLGGYSFGAWVALELARELGPNTPLVLVAPPLSRLDFSSLERHRGPTLVIVAEEDALDRPPTSNAIEARFPGAMAYSFPDTDHFFRGMENEVAARAVGFLHLFADGREHGSS